MQHLSLYNLNNLEDYGRKLDQESIHVMLVDDDDESRQYTEIMLKHCGYMVSVAGCGRDSLRTVRENKIDVVLMDCMMPGMDGFEACRLIHQEEQYEDIPVIFLAAGSNSNDKALGFSAGGADFIAKPVDPVELSARIRTHIELARTRRQLRQQARLLREIIADQSGRLAQVRSGQERLLADPNAFTEIEVGVRFVPAYEAGGDFYDIIKFREDCFGFLVADVAGHDLGTAYLTGALKALTASFTNECLTGTETMLMMNNALGKFLGIGQYATACYVKYNREKMSVEVITAGHPAPFVQLNDGNVYAPDLIGDVLGIHDVISCNTRQISVKNGQRLFIYTDGLIEGYIDDSGRSGSRRYGTQRLADQVKAKSHLSVKDAVDEIVSDLLDECDGTIGDDVVLMGIQF